MLRLTFFPPSSPFLIIILIHSHHFLLKMTSEYPHRFHIFESHHHLWSIVLHSTMRFKGTPSSRRWSTPAAIRGEQVTPSTSVSDGICSSRFIDSLVSQVVLDYQITGLGVWALCVVWLLMNLQTNELNKHRSAKYFNDFLKGGLKHFFLAGVDSLVCVIRNWMLLIIRLMRSAADSAEGSVIWIAM